ncbi:hypothetical protein [Streptomyces sp. NPDC046727]|uniref:hypothetical protein n=1 Tax=Streptomyces sp. NPDC046727 TaxID=3155373 RepID=UPI0033F92B68
MERRQGTRIRLLASDDASPKARVDPGSRFEVVVATVVDSDLQAVTDATTNSETKQPARLCGSRSTCLAIVEIE